jgi:hypothetical protein
MSLLNYPHPDTLREVIKGRLGDNRAYDLVVDLLERAGNMAGMLSSAAGAEAQKPVYSLHPAEVAAVAEAVRDEIGMALVLLNAEYDKRPN